jgi:hypothetical protein
MMRPNAEKLGVVSPELLPIPNSEKLGAVSPELLPEPL